MWIFLTLALAGVFFLIYSALIDLSATPKAYLYAGIKLGGAVGIAILISMVLDIIIALNNVSYYIPGLFD